MIKLTIFLRCKMMLASSYYLVTEYNKQNPARGLRICQKGGCDSLGFISYRDSCTKTDRDISETLCFLNFNTHISGYLPHPVFSQYCKQIFDFAYFQEQSKAWNQNPISARFFQVWLRKIWQRQILDFIFSFINKNFNKMVIATHIS